MSWSLEPYCSIASCLATAVFNCRVHSPLPVAAYRIYQMEKFSSPDLEPVGFWRITDKKDLRKKKKRILERIQSPYEQLKEIQRKSSDLPRVTKKLLSLLEPITGLSSPKPSAQTKPHKTLLSRSSFTCLRQKFSYGVVLSTSVFMAS